MTENLNDCDGLDAPWAELESALLAFEMHGWKCRSV